MNPVFREDANRGSGLEEVEERVDKTFMLHHKVGPG